MSPYLIHLAHRLKLWLVSKKPFTSRGVLLDLSDKIIGHPKKKIILKTVHGFKLTIDPVNDKGVERSIFYTGTYEAGTLDVFNKLLLPGDVYVDVGSNIGLMAIYAARKVGSKGVVHAFEPHPGTFQILKTNAEINKLNNIRLNNLALGSEDKRGIIYDNMDINRGASSLVRKDASEGKEVVITTLDKYLRENTSVKLMKVDVEGYELQTLTGASRLLSAGNAPILCIEYSKDVEHENKLEDLYYFIININRYRIFRFVSWKGNISRLKEVFTKEEMPDHDNVFCFLPEHLKNLPETLFENRNDR